MEYNKNRRDVESEFWRLETYLLSLRRTRVSIGHVIMRFAFVGGSETMTLNTEMKDDEWQFFFPRATGDERFFMQEGGKNKSISTEMCVGLQFVSFFSRLTNSKEKKVYNDFLLLIFSIDLPLQWKINAA